MSKLERLNTLKKEFLDTSSAVTPRAKDNALRTCLKAPDLQINGDLRVQVKGFLNKHDFSKLDHRDVKKAFNELAKVCGVEIKKDKHHTHHGHSHHHSHHTETTASTTPTEQTSPEQPNPEHTKPTTPAPTPKPKPQPEKHSSSSALHTLKSLCTAKNLAIVLTCTAVLAAILYRNNIMDLGKNIMSR